MTIAATTTAIPDAPAQTLVASFERSGYARVAPAILQPAEPFLELSGEDIRKRMFLTTDPQGRELCLRPDLTIPVSRDYLASAQAGKPASFCYLGAVFRHRENEPDEFLQAGIESFGRTDAAAADAEMLSLGLEATGHFGLAAPEIRIGDVGLFAALVEALDLAPAWKRRLIKDFNHKTSLAHDLEALTIATAHRRPEYQGMLAALAGSDRAAAHALVTDLLSIAGISAVGGRSVGEIADRFLEQAAQSVPASLPQEARARPGTRCGFRTDRAPGRARSRRLAPAPAARRPPRRARPRRRGTARSARASPAAARPARSAPPARESGRRSLRPSGRRPR